MKRPQFSLAAIFGFTAGFAGGLALLRASVHDERTFLLLASFMFLLCIGFIIAAWSAFRRARESVNKTSIPSELGQKANDSG
jgi:hypothetical protein